MLMILRVMLSVCDKYSDQYKVLFNASKSKCLIMPSRLKTCVLSDSMLSFHVGGKMIEVVNEWPHLGHIISTKLLDGADITIAVGINLLDRLIIFYAIFVNLTQSSKLNC